VKELYEYIYANLPLNQASIIIEYFCKHKSVNEVGCTFGLADDYAEKLLRKTRERLLYKISFKNYRWTYTSPYATLMRILFGGRCDKPSHASLQKLIIQARVRFRKGLRPVDCVDKLLYSVYQASNNLALLTQQKIPLE
jgi:hypothetical protein